MNDNATLVLVVPFSCDETTLAESIYQFNGAVMLQLQPLGQFTDSRFATLW
jgi:hypothetical protein